MKDINNPRISKGNRSSSRARKNCGNITEDRTDSNSSVESTLYGSDNVRDRIDCSQKDKSITFSEAIVYGSHLIFFFGYLVPILGDKVRQECEGYYRCAHHIRKTSLGYYVDTADTQWRDLRSSFPLLWLTLVGTTLGHWFFRRISQYSSISTFLHLDSEGAAITTWFRLVVGIVFLYVMHGRQAIVILVIAYLGFRLTRWQLEAGLIHGKGTLITWLYAIAILLFKESYRIQHLPQFSFLRPIFSGQYGGMYRWQLPANFLILRIVSYSFDFFWAVRDARERGLCTARQPELALNASEPKIANQPKRGNCSSSSRSKVTSVTSQSNLNVGADPANNCGAQKELTRANLCDQPRPLEEYGILMYFSYIFYCPLYIAGPIMSFNAFAENTLRPQQSVNPWHYAGRWVLCLGLMELLTSRFPFFAVMSSGVFPHLEPAELALVCYLTLKMMWLKFLLTWRFFRLWALADGTLAPENMMRCMSNNCSLEDFWRGWHASFNKWIVRYMYKPMGGRDTRLYSVWIIFLFVAVWHDLEWKLLVWGLLNGAFYVIEVLAKRFASTWLVKSIPTSVFRLVCVLSGATYILVLIVVNLTGYAVGVGGVSLVLNKFLTWNGVVVLMASYYFLAMTVSFMGFLKRIGMSVA